MAGMNGPPGEDAARQAPVPRSPWPGLFAFYDRAISPVDGDRCPMSPSCSIYARQAVSRYGMAKGLVMTLDRLLRCGRDETRLSPRILLNHRILTFDPVPQRDHR
ncbi:MAG: membrane protein insertion efficiency factor YidD [Deltaproteobacteria bacterium]|nr:membrane protein insertion efficiency factor YidD [Deltaproteobacteria bacterium]